MKVKDAEGEVRKDVLETEAQQKLLRGLLKGEFETAKKDMQREKEKVTNGQKK
jgi:hypothetical protein